MGGFHVYIRGKDVESRSKDPKDDHEIEWTSAMHQVPSINPLRDPGVPVHPLNPATALTLIRDGVIELRSEEEIADRSKSDWLSNLLVLVQTAWFLLQCVARGAQRMPVTQLEIITLAYLTLNCWIYLAWWDKPRNVQQPIRVYLSPHQEDTITRSQ